MARWQWNAQSICPNGMLIGQLNAATRQALQQVYSEEIDKLASPRQTSVSPMQHSADKSHAQGTARQPCISLAPSTVNVRASGGSLPKNAGEPLHAGRFLVHTVSFGVSCALRRAWPDEVIDDLKLFPQSDSVPLHQSPPLLLLRLGVWLVVVVDHLRASCALLSLQKTDHFAAISAEGKC